MILWAVAAPLLALVALAVAQVALPAIATHSLRGRLGDARIERASVSAFPAIELLWGHADNATLRLSRDDLRFNKISGLLGEAAEVKTIDARIGRLQVGPLTMHDVSFQKHGARATVTLEVQERDLQAALPVLQSVRPVSSSDGQLTLRGTAGLLGVTASVEMVVAARAGRIVIAPTGPVGALAKISVFSDPHLYVNAVSGHAVAGGLAVTVHARFK